ncbi:hypothetical protein [Phocaeicola vulgatus]|uniref:hypothetical protein n=1 Tax=Phocaeicola vulgatus TaxID=821 RepID=UPI00216611D8|nr:hypothetical protein [Phocaeicola vulgatus]MCS3105778.1 hypothetical protein [Phocaeicola vulgatus]
MQDDKKEKPKDEKKKKNKYIVKDGDGNIMDVEVPESWIKILEAMNKGGKEKMNTFSEKLFIFIWLNKCNFISLLRKTVGYIKYSI